MLPARTYKADYVLLRSARAGGCAGSRISRCYKSVVLILLATAGFAIYHVATYRGRSEVNWAELVLNESCGRGGLRMPRIVQRGRYWVLPNYIQASRKFGCDESVTYTTHGEVTFLDNLVTLSERWQGPVSVAVYAPGSDFFVALTGIRYLQDCLDTTVVRELVTFHLFFHQDHLPKWVPPPERVMQAKVSCDRQPWSNVTEPYRKTQNMTYPVNVARNVARHYTDTHFVLPSDIELFPSLNFIPAYLEMIRRGDPESEGIDPRVYVLPVFEVTIDSSVPDDKDELVTMLDNGTATYFHYKMCRKCHVFPGYQKWTESGNSEEMRVFRIGKRHRPFHYWEPIFIGTNQDPFYDERLNWEGKSDKMTQAYAMCLLDYEFHILDTGFLVHKPGIKVYEVTKEREPIIYRQNQLMKDVIYPELKFLYGDFPDCFGG